MLHTQTSNSWEHRSNYRRRRSAQDLAILFQLEHNVDNSLAAKTALRCASPDVRPGPKAMFFLGISRRQAPRTLYLSSPFYDMRLKHIRAVSVPRVFCNHPVPEVRSGCSQCRVPHKSQQPGVISRLVTCPGLVPEMWETLTLGRHGTVVWKISDYDHDNTLPFTIVNL